MTGISQLHRTTATGFDEIQVHASITLEIKPAKKDVQILTGFHYKNAGLGYGKLFLICKYFGACFQHKWAMQ